MIFADVRLKTSMTLVTVFDESRILLANTYLRLQENI